MVSAALLDALVTLRVVEIRKTTNRVNVPDIYRVAANIGRRGGIGCGAEAACGESHAEAGAGARSASISCRRCALGGGRDQPIHDKFRAFPAGHATITSRCGDAPVNDGARRYGRRSGSRTSTATRKGLCAAGHGETRRQEVVQNAGALALQLVSDLLVVVPAARKLFLLLLDGLFDFREALGLVEELSLAPPLP